MISKEAAASKIDNTILKPAASLSEITGFITSSLNHGFNSVCISPSFIEKAKEIVSDKEKIAAVIGFPLGYSSIETKVFETKDAVKKGADFIDAVINISMLKSGKDGVNYLTKELSEIRNACIGKELRIIIETCYLNREEIDTITDIITRTKCDVVKTSTGFGTSGADTAVVKYIKSIAGSNLRIKASGGIKTYRQFIDLISAGADIIGTSSGISILSECCLHGEKK